MKIVVTCGPSYEPIDQARRLTNFSTGTLGVALANTLVDAGHEVICLRGHVRKGLGTAFRLMDGFI